MEITGLNKNHQRHLITTYQYVDKILSEMEGILREAQSNSPFETYVADATPVQSRVIEDYILRIRQVMMGFLRDHDIALDNPRISAIWGARASLVGAKVAIDELDPERMSGYGQLSPQSAGELTAMIFELQNLLKQMSNFLSQHIENDPIARLKRLEELTDEIFLLQELGRIIQLHGLVELRSTLALLVERAESANFEIAVFGRVSSGKSSLLNHILKTAALPVGITPVTAIPIIIGYGDQPSAIIRFAESNPIQIELPQLPEFATEQQNPGNQKKVTQINIAIPQEQLKKGVCFIDTPGLGSLAAAGAAETMAYLPRCDLGIILIDAASTLNQEDLNTLRLLLEAGANAMVLLSKADLLKPEEQDGMVNYVHRQIVDNMKIEIPVFPVSILEPELTAIWFQSQLLPLFEKQRELATISLRRKIDALKETVQAILRNHLERGMQQPSPEQLQKRKQMLRLLKEGDKLITETKSKCEELTGGFESYSDPILKEAAAQLAEWWLKNKARQIQAGEILARIVPEFISGLNENLMRHLSEAKTRLTEILTDLAAFSTGSKPEQDELPEYANLPVPVVSPNELQLYLDISFYNFIGYKLLDHHILTALNKSEVKTRLKSILDLYSNQLNNWVQNSLQKLRRDFETSADYYQAEIDSLDNSSAIETTAEQLKEDLDILSSWPVNSKNPK
jgi:Predicted GTPases